ncbi:MAG TPA: hypothetical protein VFE47_31665 [Tepidisphaeraceae bacterium]|jgi:hypothetical protein|nr:hypothetical protein [Tepidisphaeraceae bacterium]
MGDGGAGPDAGDKGDGQPDREEAAGGNDGGLIGATCDNANVESEMTIQNLTEFFREKRAHAPAKDIDWEQRQQEWIAAIDGLYQIVTTEWLAPAIQNGLVQVDYRPKKITEDFLGTYEVREMVLRVGEEMVTFSPKGRNVIGVQGRVDLVGEMGEVPLVVQQPGNEWAILAPRSTPTRLIGLDEKTLLLALKDVMRP